MPPLEGITVLDLGGHLAGPFGAMLLGDLGADVIKIDELEPNAREMGRTSVFFGCQRGKRSLAVDLKTEAGREIVQRLIARVDVVHHNQRVGVAERLGIDYESAKHLNPRVIYCHSTGWGSSGPLATAPGWDQFVQAAGGLEWDGGAVDAGNPPMWYRFGVGDSTNAMHTVHAVLFALYHRELTGEGQLVGTSIINGGPILNSDLYLVGDEPVERPALDVEQTGFGDHYRLYRAADGWVQIAAVEPAHRAALARVLGELDPTGAGTAAARIAPAFATRPADSLIAALDAAGVPAEISDPDYARAWLADDEALASGRVAAYPMGELGELRQFGTLVGFPGPDGSARADWGPPPVRGEHTVQILGELGYGPEDVERLERDRVVRTAPPVDTAPLVGSR